MNQPREKAGAQNMPPLRPMSGPGSRPGGPMGARVNKEKPKNLKKTLMRLVKYIGKSLNFVFDLFGIFAIVEEFGN